MEKKRMTNPERLGVGSGLKTAMTVLAVLGIAAVVTMFGPSGKTVNAESESKAAKPAPTPLRADAAAALLQQLKDSLVDNLEEDAINAIQEKWDRQILTGKTREQILKLLFDQLKTVVEDEETQNTIWESWQTIGADEEPHGDGPTEGPTEGPTTRPTEATVPREPVADMPLVGARSAFWRSPEVGLTNDQKLRRVELMQKEFKDYIGQTRQFIPENGNYKGVPFVLQKDADDPDMELKVNAVKRGVAIVVDKGLTLPSNLTIYLVKDSDRFKNPLCFNQATGRSVRPVGMDCQEVMTIAYQRGINWTPIADIILRKITPTKPAALSDSGLMGLPKPSITIIHEIGHILHERHAGEFFFTLGPFRNTEWTADVNRRGAADEAIAAQVSEYAKRNKKEFVAEVFTGAVLGKTFSAEVWEVYRRYRGPSIPRVLGSITYQRPNGANQ